jgi:hypothetical protein
LFLPVGQLETHLPDEQASPLAHAFPHCPQLSTLEPVLTQAPAQRVVPLAQLVPHTPSTQNWPAGQALLQPPQLEVSLPRLTQ